MNNLPNLEDLAVFVQVAKRASFAAAASELGMSTAFISKRIRLLEQNLGVRLLHRTTRRVSVSEDGERVYHWALRILDSVQRMGDEVSALHREPSGQLRIASSLGLGRRFVAPALSELAARYPQLDIRLDVHDRLVDLVAEGVDLDIRVGNEIAANLIAKPLAKNRRVLCAAPAYLERRGTPRSLAELTSHDCLVIKERDHPFGVWHLEGPSGEENVKVTGPLSSNHGEVVHQWCLDGRGILLRSWWDVHDSLADGRLVQVLPEYQQQADIWAVHAAPLASSARVRVAVEFFRQYFAERCTLPES
ncbi:MULTISPECIES: LysR substrate-binding domain-containing protein [unclassified Pseudomonas]|uniref:LysR substrate-binding domain-containing protein n=1 Tax=unclassified Pseudomonas TaxID=196821 RepID=UPI0002A267A9|nr:MULTISPECIES: LysR substrate-binding domain-containing protein [unclassified Pseudomonas]NTX90655.1 LysR family transcriptional regulator [Pseudomonas sp. UMA643]NTY21266.1 LysR family transcriptional regulator [Pseudomonas sp. UMC3103]NTY28366.1 LysR family transcriptional regulator [Pseudomonas sp. UMA603]NTY32736.1 LysR family transcriptional regulator [Pseudomonas sp. UMC3129]NTY57868.1 LysR family transcriptional regulator [Pseudomonas sp. UMC631]NTY69864.1 LysR family transcriptional